VFLGLFLTTLAAGADSTGCGVSKGLYEGWLALAKHVPAHVSKSDALVESAPSAVPDTDKRQSAAREYQAFFRCLSDTIEHQDKEALQSYCRQTDGDRLASVVCRTALYLKSGRTGDKEFVDALPAGRKGAELVWDLKEIAGPADRQSGAGLFLPEGPAYKLIDELFLLVLDDRESAAAKYFNIAAYASADGARHMDDQIKILLREAPSVVVKKWVILRQYQPKLKKLLAEMTASLPKAELQKMRQGLGAFCSKDNPDCPEISKLFGKPE
jgi:hypothetical protein